MEEDMEIGDYFEYKQQLLCYNEACKEIPIIQLISGEEEDIKIRMICTNLDCKEKKEITLEEFNEKNKIKNIFLPSTKCKRISKHQDKQERESECFCSDCQNFLCKECLNNHNIYFEDEKREGKHSKFKSINEKKKEDKNKLIYIEEKNLYYCKYHKKEIIKYHCIECISDYCDKCVEKHKNHRPINLEEMSKKIDVDQINKNIKIEREKINDYVKIFENCKKFIQNRINKINEEIKKLEEEKDNLPKIQEKIKEMSEVFKSRNDNILDLIETLVNSYTFSRKQNYNQLFNILHYSKFDLPFCFNDYSPEEMKSLYSKSLSFDEKEYELSKKIKVNNNNSNEKTEDIKSVSKGNKILIKCKVQKKQEKNFLPIIGDSSPVNKDYCDIYINGKSIDFQKTYRFENEGEYNIELNFKKELNNLNYLFFGCLAYTKIDLRFFVSKGITSMYDTFYGCTSLKEILFGDFDTSQVNTMYALFYNCISLSNIDLSSFNTSEVSNMQYMFYCCGINKIDLSNFEFSKVQYMNYMFYGCKSLIEIKMSDSFTEDGKSFAYFGVGIPEKGILYCSGQRIIKDILSTGLKNWELIKSFK